MAQLLLIKNVNTAFKEVDDIVGFFEDSHKFDPDYEVGYYNIQQVKGYTKAALLEFAQNKGPDRQTIFKMKVADQWTLEEPEMKEAWKHTDGKWYFLMENPKCKYTIKNMTEQERIILASEVSSSFDKLNALAHLESKISMDSKNLVEIAELNK